MLSNRMKQFREYNNLSIEDISAILGIDTTEYNTYESGKAIPDIDLITKLSICYKVTVDEFYGYSPKLLLYTKDEEADADIDELILKMSDLSWDEAQLVMYYRQLEQKENLMDAITKELYKKTDDSTDDSP